MEQFSLGIINPRPEGRQGHFYTTIETFSIRPSPVNQISVKLAIQEAKDALQLSSIQWLPKNLFRDTLRYGLRQGLCRVCSIMFFIHRPKQCHDFVSQVSELR